METKIDCMASYFKIPDLGTIPNGSFRIPYQSKKSKTVEFFEDLYTYPPTFRVKWDTIDELHEDLFMSYNYRVLDQNFPFLESLTDFFSNKEDETSRKISYSYNSYLKGYLNKITSTRFYNSQTKKLQEALQNIPVYTILNGQGEIVLATSTDFISSNSANFNQTVYDVSGSFDPLTEKNTQLGLFFMAKKDAEVYLKEIAKSDTQGTQMLGLSIHCFGLDFAYRVMREYHPNIDFRYIPNLAEIQDLMTSRITGDSNLIFENGQQQLRFRRRPITLFPLLNQFTKRILPLSSFLEKIEYFKGVPIYVVKVNKLPNNFFLDRSQTFFRLIDGLYGRVINSLGVGVGLGNGLILQGLIFNQPSSEEMETYIFFNKKESVEFCQQYKRRIVRYKGSCSKFFESFIKTPKVLVFNLEDFLEIWEDGLVDSPLNSNMEKQNCGFDFKTVNFVPTKQDKLEIETYFEQNKRPALRKIVQFFNFKYRRLNGFFGVLLNTN